MSLKVFVKSFALLYILVAAVSSAHADDLSNNSDSFKGWLALGAGGFVGKYDGLGIGALGSFSFQKDSDVFILRSAGFLDDAIEDIVTVRLSADMGCSKGVAVGVNECFDEERKYKTLGFLYGKRTRNRILAIGLEQIKGHSDYSVRDIATNKVDRVSQEVLKEIGLACGLQLLAPLSNYFGLSISGMANLNKEHSYLGVALNLTLGYSKYR